MPHTPRLRRVGAGHLAVVIASAALFVALDGPTQAAGLITGKDIKDKSVTGKDVKDASLTGADVKDDSLTGGDVNESSLGKVPAAVSADAARSTVVNSVNGDSVTDKSLSLADYATVRGTTSINYDSIPASSCLVDLIDTGLDSLAGSLWVVNLDTNISFANGGLSYHTSMSTAAGQIRVNACNVTNAAIDPGPATFQWAVLR
jgi:hypothetical protein